MFNIRFWSSLLISLELLFIPTWHAVAQQASPTPGEVAIMSPQPGQALQGNIAILVNITVPDLQSAELSFSYSDNPTDTWFLISETTQAVSSGKLAEWDTTIITDGNYTLRLLATKTDGSQLTALVPGLRVRNYTPIETATPAPPTATLTPVPGLAPIPSITASASATSSPIPNTPTPMPPNPAQMNSRDMLFSILQGVFIAFAVFALIGLYIAVRRLLRK